MKIRIVETYIRLDKYKEEKLKVCSHIVINGKKDNDIYYAEYVYPLIIHCKICKKDYIFSVLSG